MKPEQYSNTEKDVSRHRKRDRGGKKGKEIYQQRWLDASSSESHNAVSLIDLRLEKVSDSSYGKMAKTGNIEKNITREYSDKHNCSKR